MLLRLSSPPGRPQTIAGSYSGYDNGSVDVVYIQVTEVVLVTEQPDRDKTGKDDRADQHAAGSRFQPATELFNGKDDAGQWRVEGRCDASGSTGKNEILRAQGAGVRQPFVDSVHDRGRHLDGRSFAAREVWPIVCVQESGSCRTDDDHGTPCFRMS